MERLEDRLLLATIQWDGGGDATNWHDPQNWVGDVLPGASDDAMLGEATFGTVVLSTSTVVSSLTNNATLLFRGGSLQGEVFNSGSLFVERGGNTIAGTFTNAGTLRLQATNNEGHSVLTVSQGLTNTGLIELAHPSTNQHWNVQLNVTAGALVNEASGVITALADTNNGNRQLTAQLDNRGTVNVGFQLLLNKAGVAHSNSGVVEVSAANLQIVGAGTSLSNAGTMRILGGAINATSVLIVNHFGALIGGHGILGVSQFDNQGVLDLTPPSVIGMRIDPSFAVVSFHAPAGLNESTVVDTANYMLIGSGLDGSFDNGNEIAVQVNTINYDALSQSATLIFPLSLSNDDYLMSIDGNAVLDVNGTSLFVGGAVQLTQLLGEVPIRVTPENTNNNSIASATLLPLFESPSGSGFLTSSIAVGAIDPQGEGDYWSFNAQQGDQLVIDLEASDNFQHPRLLVQNAAGQNLLDSGPAWFGNPTKATNNVYTIPATGTYYVYVSNFHGGDYRGSYQFRLDLGRGVQLEPYDVNFYNNSLDRASGLSLTTLGDQRFGTIAGNLYSQEGVDYYNIGTVQQGETIFATIRLPSQSTLSPKILIRDNLNQFYPEVAFQPSSDGIAQVAIENVGGGRTFYIEVAANSGVGIRGQYLLDVRILPTGSQPFPDLFVPSVTASAQQVQAGGQIDVTWTVRNDGNAATQVSRWTDDIFISRDTRLSADDVSVATFAHEGVLQAAPSNNRYTETRSITLPQHINGPYYLLVKTDSGNSVSEFLLEGNNTGSSESAITVVDDAGPRMVSLTPTVVPTPPLERVTVVFNERIDAATFTVEDVTLRGPSGQSIAVSSVIGSGTTFIVEFPSQSELGLYTVEIGPIISDLAGNLLDQDNDGVLGEAVEDVAVRTVQVGSSVDLIVSEVTGPSAQLIGNPATAEISWTITNQGVSATTASQWTDRVVLSTNNIFGDADDQIRASVIHNGTLAAGEHYTETLSVTLPVGLDGDYYLFVYTDALNQVAEGAGEGNNVSQPLPISVVPPYADLILDVVTAGATAESGQPLTVNWRVRNVGIAVTNAMNWQDGVFLSADGVLDGTDALLGTVSHIGELGVDGNYTATADLMLPEGIEGAFFVFVVTDLGNAVFERQGENNNIGRSEGAVTVTRRPEPDLQVIIVTAPTSGQPGQVVEIGWTVSNVADGIADGVATVPWVDRVYLSNNGATVGATLLATVPRDTDLAVGGSYQRIVNIALPNVADGNYQILVVADEANAVYEGGPAGNDGNNTGAAPGLLTMGHPNLTPSQFVVPGTATAGDTVNVQWMVVNSGTATSRDSWVDRIYLSFNTTFEPGSDRLLGERIQAGPLLPNGNYQGEFNIPLPIDVSGGQFLLLITDAANAVNELADEANLIDRSIAILAAPHADLTVRVDGVSGPPEVLPEIIGDPAEISVQWTVTNSAQTSTGPTNAVQWVDKVILSRDSVVGNGDDFVKEFAHTGLLGSGARYARDETFLLPPSFEGRYQLFVITDSAADVFEGGLEANNISQAASPVDIMRIPYSDLRIASIVVPATAQSGQLLDVTWAVRNLGIGLTHWY